MTDKPPSTQLLFEPIDNDRLRDLCGPSNEHLSQIEKHFAVKIDQRGNGFVVSGAKTSQEAAKRVLQRLYDESALADALTHEKVFLSIKQEETNMNMNNHEATIIHLSRCTLNTRTDHQADFVRNIRKHDINFAIGPAGTGKTYLAVATAVEALETDRVQRLIFVRPAVEAGEKLGFLPGDLAEKILPYLKPLYDALYDMMGVEHVERLMEKHVIEIAPLAFMRGRTLSDAFIILDEAQNTTVEQMKMFLTRVGFGSTAVITGDVSQIDLPKHVASGLNHAVSILESIDAISFNYFDANDTVRHALVRAIIQAYEKDNRDDR